MDKPTRAQVVTLRERALEHHRTFRYLTDDHRRTLLLLCDWFLDRQDDARDEEAR